MSDLITAPVIKDLTVETIRQTGNFDHLSDEMIEKLITDIRILARAIIDICKEDI